MKRRDARRSEKRRAERRAEKGRRIEWDDDEIWVMMLLLQRDVAFG